MSNLNKPFAQLFVERIIKQLKQKDENYFGIMCGAVGSGKSESCIRLAQMIKPDFPVKNIIFGVEEMFELITNEELEKGDVIVFEELGVNVGRLNYYSDLNNAIVNFLQYGRALNLALLMNAPDMDFADSRILKASNQHNYFYTHGIDKRGKIAHVGVHNIHYNSILKKYYYPHPVIYEDRRMIVLDEIDFYKPDDSIIIPYKEKKMQFIKEQSKRDYKAARESNLDKRLSKDFRPSLEKVLAEPEKYIKTYNKNTYLDPDLISGMLGETLSNAKKIKKIAERKLGLS